MSGIVSAAGIIAEVRKISVTPGLERRWRVLEILDDVKSGYRARFCQFAPTWQRKEPLMQRVFTPCCILTKQTNESRRHACWWSSRFRKRTISPPLSKIGRFIFSASQFFVNQCGHPP
ncbi:MAG: hypothetical protein LBB21_05435 [Holosporaceae bacterium]|nr:hypothetical protein [Holosporaceae bacterium]